MSVAPSKKGTETQSYPGLEHQPKSPGGGGPLIQSLRRFLRAQFGRPSGFVGSMVGRLMARRPSNIDRIRWVLSLLHIGPTDRVFEVGFGPGVSVQMVSDIATQGFVAGVDHSAEMVQQAIRRNAKAVRSGRVALQVGSASSPPAFDTPFDKIFTINSIHFWENPAECLAKLRRMLKPGGQIAVAIQPRSQTATDETTTIISEEIKSKLKRAGFSQCRVEIRATAAAPIACILAINEPS